MGGNTTMYYAAIQSFCIQHDIRETTAQELSAMTGHAKSACAAALSQLSWDKWRSGANYPFIWSRKGSHKHFEMNYNGHTILKRFNAHFEKVKNE